MKCSICYYGSADTESLKHHYISYHQINSNNYFFKELFQPDNYNIHSERCDECQMQFRNHSQKKNHNFIFHREQQVGGSTNQQLLLNILRRGVITYFSINYYQHRTFYDFFDSEKIVDSFLNTLQRSSVPNKKVKSQGYIELINYEQAELIELESKRVWVTDVFTGKYFNQYIRAEIRTNFLKKVIINGATGSSWHFKRFEKISL